MERRRANSRAENYGFNSPIFSTSALLRSKVPWANYKYPAGVMYGDISQSWPMHSTYGRKQLIKSEPQQVPQFNRYSNHT